MLRLLARAWGGRFWIIGNFRCGRTFARSRTMLDGSYVT